MIIVNAPSLINFAIGGVTYQAESGMTWQQWVVSDYAPSGLYIDDGMVYSGSSTLYVYRSNWVETVWIGDRIDNSNTYKFATLIGFYVKNSDMGTEPYGQAESGMTWQQWINSEYNRNGSYIQGDYINFAMPNPEGEGFYFGYIYDVTPSDVIIPEYTYYQD